MIMSKAYCKCKTKMHVHLEHFREAAIAGFCNSFCRITAETQLSVPVFIARETVLHNCYCPGIFNYLHSEVALEFPIIHYKLKKKVMNAIIFKVEVQ